MEDLDQIFVHTARTWSVQQAIRYIDQLEDGFFALAAMSMPGRPCADFKPGLRRQLVASHIVYFFANDDEFTVARVLHKKMSPVLHTF